MEQQKLLDELNYHRADKTAKMLLNLGLITTVEYDKLQELNRQKFSPILADLFPKSLADCPKTKKILFKRQRMWYN